jgi:hypothetical protein
LDANAKPASPGGGIMPDALNDFDAEVKALMAANCSHVCHERGLNPWVQSCPTCGCDNPVYDPKAVSDIVSPFDEFKRLFDLSDFGCLFTRRK